MGTTDLGGDVPFRVETRSVDAYAKAYDIEYSPPTSGVRVTSLLCVSEPDEKHRPHSTRTS